MKRIVLLFVLMMAGTTVVSAQDAPIIPEREIVVVDNFTAVPNLTLGLYQYARQSVIEGLAKKRINVIDVEEDGIGRPDIVYPSPRFAHGNTGRPFDMNRVANIMNTYSQARWYITVYISKFNSHPVDHQSKDKDGKPLVKTDFSADLEADIYIYDMETTTLEGPIRWHSTYTGASTLGHAEEAVVSNLSQKARSFVTDQFRYKASVIQLGEYNKRGKLQDLYLSCGSDMDVSNGDVFFIYTVSEINGIVTAKKLGKVKAREITGRESCRCSVQNGEADIDQAFKNGETLVAVSDHDRYF
jgi:hypothetical protein